MRVLLVALDELAVSIAQSAAQTLQLEVACAPDLESARPSASHQEIYHILLSALTDPSPVAQLRGDYPLAPLIVLSATASIGQAVACLQLGAADYIPQEELSERRLVDVLEKAMSLRRSLERFRPLAHRLLNYHPFLTQPSLEGVVTNAAPPMKYRIGDLEIDERRRLVTYGGEEVDLSPTEYNILRLLARAAPQVVTFEELAYRLQGVQLRRDEARKMLSAHLSNLRAKLRAVGCDQYFINRRGQGYALDLDPDAELRRAEARLQMIAENSLDILGRMDTRGVIHYINPAVERVLGYPPSYFIGKSVFDLLAIIHPQDAQFWSQRLQERRYERSLDQFRVRHAGGDYIWLEASSRLVNRHKGLGDIFFIMRDISERKAAEEALRYSEERWRLLFKSSPSPAYLWKREGDDFILTDYSDSAVGYTRGGIQHYLGVRARELLPNADTFLPYFWRCLESGEPQSFDWHYPIPSSDEVAYAIVRCNRVPPDGVLVHFNDITQRAQLEHALRESERTLRALLDHLPIVLARFDTEGRCIFVNRSSRYVFGRAVDFFLGRTIYQMQTDNPQALSEWAQAITKALHSRQTVVLHQKAAGQNLWKAVIPEWDEKGELTSYLCVVAWLSAIFNDAQQGG